MSKVVAASKKCFRTILSPCFEKRPFTLVSPHSYRLGVRPRYAPALDDFLKRDASSNADTTDSAVIISAPGAVISSAAVGLVSAA